MTGRIIYEPAPPARCETAAGCPDRPPAADYRDGTIWECGLCSRWWEKWSGSQYNEPFDTWRQKRRDDKI